MDLSQIRNAMDSNLVTIISTTVIAVLGTQTAATLARAWSRRRGTPEARSLEVRTDLDILGASQDVVAMLRQELDRLSARVKALEEKEAAQSKRIEALSKENGQLRQRVDELERENRELHSELRRVEEREVDQ